MNSRPPVKPAGNPARGQAGPSLVNAPTTHATRPVQPGAVAEDRSRRKDAERHQPKVLEKGPSANDQGKNVVTSPRAKDIKHVAKPAPATIRCTTTPIDAPYAALTTSIKANETPPKSTRETAGPSSATSSPSKTRRQGDTTGLKPGQRDLSWVPVRSTITPIDSGHSTPALVDRPGNTMRSTGLSSRSVAPGGGSKEDIVLEQLIDKVKQFRETVKSRPPYPRVDAKRSLAGKAKINAATQVGSPLPAASSSTAPSVQQSGPKAPEPKAMRSVGVQAFASGDSNRAPSAAAKAPTVTSPKGKEKVTTTTGIQAQADPSVKPSRPAPHPERKQAVAADPSPTGHRAATASPSKSQHPVGTTETRKPAESIKTRKPTETAKPVSAFLTRTPQEKAAVSRPSDNSASKPAAKPAQPQAACRDTPRAGVNSTVAAFESTRPRPRPPKPATVTTKAAAPRDSPKETAPTKKAPVAASPSEPSTMHSVPAKSATTAQRDRPHQHAEPSTKAREPVPPPMTASPSEAPAAEIHPKASATVSRPAPKEPTSGKAADQSSLAKSSFLLRPVTTTPKASEKRPQAADSGSLTSSASPAAVRTTAAKAVPPSPGSKPRRSEDVRIDKAPSPKPQLRAEEGRTGPTPSHKPRRSEDVRMSPPHSPKPRREAGRMDPPPAIPKRPSTAEASTSSAATRPLQPKPVPRPVSESVCSERITSMVSYVPSVVSVKEGPQHQLRLSKADTVFSSAGSILHCTSPLQALTRDLARTSSEASTSHGSVRQSGSSAASVAFSAAGSEATVSKTTVIERARREPSLQSIPRSFTIASSEDTSSIRSADIFAVLEHIPQDTDTSSGYSSITHSPALVGNKPLPHAPSRSSSVLAAESLAKLDESIARLELFAPTTKSAMKQRADLVSCTLGDGYAMVDANDVPGSDELSAGPSKLQSSKAVRFNVAFPNHSESTLSSSPTSDTDSHGSPGKGKARAPKATAASPTDGPPRYSSLSPLKGGFAADSSTSLSVRGRRERSQSDVTGTRLQHSRSVPFLCRTSTKLQKLKENHAREQQEQSLYANQQASRSAASLGTGAARRRLAWGEDEEPVKRSAAKKLWDRAKNGLGLGKKEEQPPKYKPPAVTWMTPASNVQRVRRMPDWWPAEKESVMPP